MSQTTPPIERLPTGVPNLDALLCGGLPKGTVTVIAGPPGAGKTILAQQICFHNATPDRRVLYFNTLSEPTAKTLRYLRQFAFFDAAKMHEAVEFLDLGTILRSAGLERGVELIMEHVRRAKPAIVVVDTFRVFDDLSDSRERLRKFGYELVVNLMAWEATVFLLGEFSPEDIATNPLFSIIDAMILMHQASRSGEQQRILQVTKMRGTAHSREEHPFEITRDGILIYAAPQTMLLPADLTEPATNVRTGLAHLDQLLGDGIRTGSTLLVSGVAGSGKTALSLELVYRGAQLGEKGIVFSFEEPEERLLALAKGFGWDLEAEIARGMVEIVFIPLPTVAVEANLLMMHERIRAMGARRVVIDSVSVFLRKLDDARAVREKLFQLTRIIYNERAIGIFTADVRYGTNEISRSGEEETVVDGVLLLSSIEEGFERERYIEIFKMRNAAHLKGRHGMSIGAGGVTIYPRYYIEAALSEPPPALDTTRRVTSGVDGLDALLGGGFYERSVTLVSGSAGIGKSTLAMQFVTAAAERAERGLFVSLEESPAQVVAAADRLGLPLRAMLERDIVEIAYLPRERVRPIQFLSFLTDRIEARQARVFVLDGIGHLGAGTLLDIEVRQLLYALVARLKALGVTTIMTIEASSMYSTEAITDRRFSPVADNLLALRYMPVGGEIRPTISVMKTRASPHDFGTYSFMIHDDGARVGPRMGRDGIVP